MRWTRNPMRPRALMFESGSPLPTPKHPRSVADDLAWRVPSTPFLAMSSSVTRVSIAGRTGAGVRPVHGCKRTARVKRFLADTVIPRTLAQNLSPVPTAKNGRGRVRTGWERPPLSCCGQDRCSIWLGTACARPPIRGILSVFWRWEVCPGGVSYVGLPPPKSQRQCDGG
jgi:hypothetical protein